MTPKHRQQAIANVQERLEACEALRLRGPDDYYRRYRAALPENIVNAVLAFEHSPDDLDRLARAMHKARERWQQIRQLESCE